MIKKIERHKTPEPDEISAEYFKEMTEDNKFDVLQIINDWWLKEDMPK